MKPSLMVGGLLALGLLVGCGGPEMDIQEPVAEATSSTSSELFPDCVDYEGTGCPTPYSGVTCFNSNTGMPGACTCLPEYFVWGCY